MDKALEAMLAKAEEIYTTSTANYPNTSGPRRGIAVVSVRRKKTNRWLTLQDNFGKTCYRAPKILNCRPIDLGGSNEGLVFGKIAYCHRTKKDSGCDAREIKEGESFWQGAIWGSTEVLFAFSGFSELDDVEVAKAGERAYFEN